MSSVRAAGQDLWQQALDRLDPPLKASLQKVKSGRRNVLEVALQEAEKKRESSYKYRWKVTIDGKEVIIRDVLGKIVGWIQKFREIGDVAVQYDPHISLIWAGVRFLLQTVVQDDEVHAGVVADLEMITRLLARYKEFEKRYLTGGSDLQSQIEDALIKLYIKILECLASAIRFLDEPTAKRLLKAPFRSIDRSIQQNILSREEEVLKFASLDDRAKLLSMEIQLARVYDQALISKAKVEEEEFFALLQWLSPTPFMREHESVSKNRMPQSGSWLPQQPQYLDWHSSSSSSILLLHGIRGCGKTYLASFVIDNILTQQNQQGNVAPLAYFYCADSESRKDRRDPEEVLRSIVRQLTVSNDPQQPVHTSISSCYDRKKARAKLEGSPTEVPRLSVTECRDLIMETLDNNPAIILIDALDEVMEERRHELVATLVEIVQTSANVVKVFLTSRDDERTLAMLPDAQVLQVSERLSSSDVERFAQSSVAAAIAGRTLLKGEVTTDLQNQIVSGLAATAGEMFIWVKMQLSQLCRLRHRQDVEVALRNLNNSTIDDLYMETFLKIKKSGEAASAFALRAFSWLLYVQDPLPASGLTRAITAGSDLDVTESADLVWLCFNFVQLVDLQGTSLGDTFRFAHHSVQEFLRQQPELHSSQAHRILASCCLSICDSSLTMPTSMSPIQVQILSDYAVVYWPFHLAQSDMRLGDDALFQQAADFIFDEEETGLMFSLWLHNLEPISESLPRNHVNKAALSAVFSPSGDAVFTLSVFGVRALLMDHVRLQSFDWNIRNDAGQTPLYLACFAGNYDIAKYLIGKGAEVNVECGSYGSPLHVACFRGFDCVVDLPLTHGADVSTGKVFGGAMSAAFRGDNEGIVLSLLKNNCKPKSQDEFDSLMHDATSVGFAQVIRLLQAESKYRQQAPEKEKSAARKAIASGRIDGLLSLMKKSNKALILLPDDGVSIAAANCHHTGIKALLNAGLSIETPGVLGTPLRSACLVGHEPSVRVLLDHGVNVNCNTYGNALHAAAMKGNSNVVRLLLDNGADVNLPGDYYGTALQAACFRGHLRVVELLIDANADVRAEGYSKDAFDAAAIGEHHDIVNYLLRKGYSPKSPPTIVFCSDMTSPEDTETEIGDERQLVTEHILAAVDDETIKEPEPNFFLLDNVSKSKLRDKFREHNALYMAASHGNLAVVREILKPDHKLVLFAEWSSEIEDALRIAMQNGHYDVAEAILTSEDLSTSALQECLSIALSKGDLPTMNLILSQQPMEILMKTLELADIHQHDLRVEVSRKIFETLTQYCSQTQKRDLMPRMLGIAARAGDVDTVTAILSSGVVFEKAGCEFSLLQASLSQDKSLFVAIYDKLKTKERCVRLVGQCLRNAATKGHTAMLDAIMKTTNINDLAPLAAKVAVWHAAAHGHTDSVQLLLGVIRADDLVHLRRQALDLAVSNGHHTLILWLLNQGTDLDASSEFLTLENCERERMNGMIELRRANREGYDWIDDEANEFNKHDPETGMVRRGSRKLSAIQACLERLVELGYERLSDIRSHGRLSSRNQTTSHERILKVLIEYGADVNALGGGTEYPLCVAVKVCSAECIAWLIDHGADVNLHLGEMTVLENAMNREIENLAVVKKLLQTTFGDDLTTAHLTKLSNIKLDYAKRYKYEQKSKTLDYFVTKGLGGTLLYFLGRDERLLAKGDYFGGLLQMVTAFGDATYVKLLIDRQVDVNFEGFCYGTALQAACHFGREDIVVILLKAGANPNIVKGKHRTALRAAIKAGHAQVAKVLLDVRSTQVDLVSVTSRAERYYWSRHEDYDTDSAFDRRSDADDQQAFRLTPVPAPTPLQIVITRGNEQLALMLLGVGANLRVTSKHCQHMLIAACQFGSPRLVDDLLSRGADVNIRGKPRWPSSNIKDREASAMHMAIHRGALDLVQVLLNHGFDTNACFKKSRHDILSFAARCGHKQIIDILLSHSEYSVKDIRSAALAAVRSGSLPLVKSLIEIVVSQTGTFDTIDAIIVAGSCGQREIMETLLDRCSIDELERVCNSIPVLIQKGCVSELDLIWEYTACTSDVLVAACIWKHSEVVSTAISQGVDPNQADSAGYLPLHAAASRGHLDIVIYLLEHGARCDMPCDRLGSVVRATLEGFAKVVLGIQIRYKPFTSQLPAVPGDGLDFRKARAQVIEERRGYPKAYYDITRTLIQSGARAETEPGSLGTALHLAAMSETADMFDLLRANGADCSARGGCFKTVFRAACEGGNNIIIQTILRESDSAVRDLAGGLLSACKRDDVALVKILLDHGADPNATDSDGKSPLHLALTRDGYFSDSKRHNGSTVFDLLLQHGDDLRINEDHLVAAIRWDRGRDTCFRRLLELDRAVEVTEKTMIRCFDDSLGWRRDDEAISYILETKRLKRVTKNLVQRIKCSRDLKLLLDYDPDFVGNTDALNSASTLNCLKVILEYAPDVSPDESLVEHILASQNKFGVGLGSIEFLWDRNPNLRVTDWMLMTAKPREIIDVLLPRCDPKNRPITGNIIDAILGFDSQVSDRFLALRKVLDFDPAAVVTDEQILVAIKAWARVDTFEVLLRHNPSSEIGGEVLCAAFELFFHRLNDHTSEQHKFIDMLESCEKKVRLTSTVRALICRIVAENDFIAKKKKRSEIEQRLKAWFTKIDAEQDHGSTE